MQPKQTPVQVPEHVRQNIDKTVLALNMIALAHFARLLKNCGVIQPVIHRAFFLP